MRSKLPEIFSAGMEDINVLDNTTDINHVCPVCSISLGTQLELENHSSNCGTEGSDNTAQINYVCPICCLNLESQFELETHASNCGL